MSLKQLIKSAVPSAILSTLHNIYSTAGFIPTIVKKYFGKRYLTLRLDTNNTCNLRCKYCYTLSLGRKKPRKMTIDEFKKIADELFPQSSFVALSCAWEPLMNRDFVDYINIAAEYKIPYLEFATNGQLLNNEIIIASIKTPVHKISISIDAANKAMYEEIRENASFDRVINNLKRIYDLKKENNSMYPKVGITFTVFEQNSSEAPEFIRKYNKYFNAITINHMLTKKRNDSNPYTRMSDHNFKEMIRQCKKIIAGKPIEFNFNFSQITKSPLLCSTSLKYILISSNGDITICAKKIIGNIFVNSYKDIFKANKRIYRKMYFGKADYCKKCGS